LRLALLVAGYDDSRTGNRCHDRRVVHRRCEQPVIAIAPRGCCGFPKALPDLIEARNAFSKAVKRMEDGKPPQRDAPEPQFGRDPSLLETWQFERGVCERVARQFRCVGDALAWWVFGFERRNIIALCQNDPPGVWTGKVGAPAELDAVEQAYRRDGQFAILHDMTNCLRIGDVTIFGNDC
jgi:hypothetical protein